MALLKRIGLFALTNIAVLVLFGLIMMIVGKFFPSVGNFLQSGYYIQLLIFAAMFGFLGAFVSLWISRWSAKKAYGIVLLNAQSAAEHKKLERVWNTVERIARENNIKMPEVGYYESAEPNAFATGATKNSALVAVSTGLLNNMEVDEVEGVVGHEMAHVLNGDMVTMTLVQGVMNTFVIFLSNVVARAIDTFVASQSDDGEGLGYFAYYGVYFVLNIAFGFLASLVVMWFSRHREYRADLGGAKYTSKAKMIVGLQRLKKMTALQDENGNSHDSKMAAFMITEPDSMFSTHPSLDNRIKALEENYSLA